MQIDSSNTSTFAGKRLANSTTNTTACTYNHTKLTTKQSFYDNSELHMTANIMVYSTVVT